MTDATPRPPGAAPPGDAPRALTAFQRAVVDAVVALRPGEVVTYREVATEAGSPGAAQAVANVLRSVDGLPWWRVVPASGRLYRTHAALQAPLLRAEGVLVDDERHVDGTGPLVADPPTHRLATDFERAYLRGVADRTALLVQRPGAEPWGEVVDTSGAPNIFDHTFVAVDRPVDARSVLAAVEEHLPDAPSPRIRVDEPLLARRLLPALRAHGWEPGWLAVCRWEGPAPPAVDAAALLDLDGLTSWTRVVQPRQEWSTPAAVEDAVRLLRRLDAVVGLRGAAATAPDGDVQGACRLYEAPQIAQIEEVEVLAEHRGSGAGRRVVRAALRAALDSDATRPVVLVADADDWPLRWYRRLGFVDVGRRCVLTRRDG